MDIVIIEIDLGKNSCSLAGMDALGRVVLRRRMRRSSLESFDIGVSRTVFGRACLLGDAAFAVRPHTAAAAATAAGDAMSLATAIHRAGRNVDAALAGWQASQIERGQELLQYGVAVGQRWAKAR